MPKKVLSHTRSLMVITFSILLLLGFVAGGTGGAASLTARTATQQNQAQFAYVTNSGSQDVSMYQVNQNSGQLQPIGTVPAGSGPQAVAVAPATEPSRFAVTGRPVFVANQNSNNVSEFSINPGTGQLNSVGTVPAGSNPQAVAIDPQCQVAIVANGGSNNVSLYRISMATGALMPAGTAPAGQRPVAVAIDPSGQMALVANQGSSNISVYNVNRSAGTLTPVGQPVPMPPGSGAPSSIAVLPTGNVAVATSPSTNTMALFLIPSPPNPFLPLVPIAAVPVSSGSGPTSIAIGPNGIAAVTLRSQGGGIEAESTQQVGAVALFQISPMGANFLGIAPAGSGPVGVAINPAGFAYVTNKNSNNISAFAITSGFPMPVGQPVPTRTSPQGVALAF